MSALEIQVYEIFKTKPGEKEGVFLVKEDKIDLIKQMKEDKIDLIKWMVGIWIAQMAAIAGLYLRK